MRELLVGADIGGSTTRVAVADLTEGVLSSATGGVGNPNLVGVDGSAAVIHDTVERALAPVAGTVVAVVMGLAGGGRTLADRTFLTAALGPELAARARIVSDASVAFCSATPAEDGYVLIAGTGAVAGRVTASEVHQRQDGWGWLLGDQGSGFWLGRAAVRSTLLALDTDRLLGPLHTDVLAATDARDALDLVRACYAEPPISLARLAPLVSRHADSDPVAGEIADQAARLLADTLLRVGIGSDLPVVLAGSVLSESVTAGPSPVGRRLRERITHLGNPVLIARSGLVGAVWLAGRQHGSTTPSWHQLLVETSTGQGPRQVTPISECR